MTTDAYLYDLSFEQLEVLSGAVVALCEAGRDAEEHGWAPRFLLIPGQPLSMTLAFRMPLAAPEVPGLEPFDFGADPSDDDAILDTIIGERSVEDFHKRKMAEYHALKKFHDPAEFEAPLSSAEDFIVPVVTDGAKFPVPTPQEPEPGIGGEGVAVTVPAEPLPGVTWPAGAFVDNALDQPAPACPPGSASALAASSRPLAWSDAEIDLTISLIVAAVQQGQTRSVGIEMASVKMGRGLDAVRKYVTRHLQERITEALQRNAADPHLPEPPPDADALTAHLLSMPRKDGWTLERDLDLVAMLVENGWGSQDIAVDLGLDTKAVKARWDALTGLSRDEKTDKWVRRYAGRVVLDRLKTLSGGV